MWPLDAAGVLVLVPILVGGADCDETDTRASSSSKFLYRVNRGANVGKLW